MNYADKIAVLRKFPEKTLRGELERAKGAGDRQHARAVEDALRSNGYGTTGIRTGMPGINYVREYMDPPYNTRAIFKPVVDPAFPDANFIETCGFYGPGARGVFNRALVQEENNRQAEASRRAAYGGVETMMVRPGEQLAVLKPGQKIVG